jgi:two-component system sensor histidine kinase DegS
MVLSAQEDLRREISRAMHDGPAQSLTNIVLQAQIVDRLVARDPEQAKGEIKQLVAMVQSTLDATKSFIFDVRPMVLDDLGVVPTLRRAARERGRRAHVPVEFESFGSDRRMAMEVEGGLFRILDETLGAFLSSSPDRVTIRLDWSDQVEALVSAERTTPTSGEPWVALAPSDWRDIQGRAATLGIAAELSSEGAELSLVAELPPLTESQPDAPPSPDPG